METILLKLIENPTQLGIIALLGVIIYMLVKSQMGQRNITENHLSCLPELMNELREIKELMQKVNDNIIWIKSRINKE